jgi:hypothetical protein
VQKTKLFVIETLRNIWVKIPDRWRGRILSWGLPFLFGLVIVWIWGIGTLLVVLFVLFLILFLLFNMVGDGRIKAASQWSITEFFTRIRGMLLFALLPIAWELIKDPSIESITGLFVLAILALFFWNRFNQMMGNFLKEVFGITKKGGRE